jgi:CRP-like cAMP-binding protein
MTDDRPQERNRLHVKSGERVFAPGDFDLRTYIILSGSVNFYPGTDPDSPLRESLGPGEVFGEENVLDTAPRHSTAVATADTELISVPRGTFLRMVRQNREIAMALIGRLSKRVKDLERARLAVDTDHDNHGVRFALASVLSGRSYAIPDAGAVIGRRDPKRGIRPDVDLSGEDPKRSVSRKHAAVTLCAGKPWIERLPGATNGTFVNGIPLTPGETQELAIGDRIGIGTLIFVFDMA